MKWKKPSGMEMDVNDDQATIDYCESLGWERMDGVTQTKDEPPVEPPEPKRRRRMKRE